MSRHPGPSAGHEPPLGEGLDLGWSGLRLLVAPAAGRLRMLPPRSFRDGREWLDRGEALARVEQGGRSDAILAPVSGRVGGVLRRDGEPVAAGEPVAWMEPA